MQAPDALDSGSYAGSIRLSDWLTVPPASSALLSLSMVLADCTSVPGGPWQSDPGANSVRFIAVVVEHAGRAQSAAGYLRDMPGNESDGAVV